MTEPWTPPNRTPRELRNARVKVVGSCVIILGLVVVAAWVLL